jgi:ribosomal 50S subunit-recycling heat shock protein
VPPQRQTNIRLDEPTFEWLEAVAFIHRRSVADELRAAVDDWLDKHRADARVRAAKELRDPEEEEAQVSLLDDRRKRTRKRDG